MAAEMQTLQRILVASDFSDQAGVAIDRAVELAREHEAELSILHVIDEELPKDVQSYLMTKSDHHLRSLIDRKPAAKEITKTIDIVVGRPDIDIAERADVERADLIVVGLHNRILEENLQIQGSIAEKIIQTTHQPVLVVKDPPRGPYSSVVVGVDFSAYSREALRAAAMVAPRSDMHLVNAYEEHSNLMSRFRDSEAGSRALEQRAARRQSFAQREMAALESNAFEGLAKPRHVDHVFERGDPATVLAAQADHAKADLISVGTHGRVGIVRTLLGSVATEVLNDRLADVLVVRPY